jgi:putative salt-induced outer membrane protein YdiY
MSRFVRRQLAALLLVPAALAAREAQDGVQEGVQEGAQAPAAEEAPVPTPPAPPAAPPTPAWTLQAKVAYAQTRGNSDTANGAAQLAYSAHRGPWELGAQASGLWARQQETTVAESYEAGALARRRLDERRGLVFVEEWRRAPLQGIDFRNQLGMGVDLRVVDGPRWELFTELGLAWGHEEPTIGDGSDFGVGIVVLANRVKLSPTATTTQRLTTYLEGGVDRRRYEGKAALQVALTRRLALEVGYDFHHDTDPVPGARRTDTALNTSLVLNLAGPPATGSQ